MTLSDTIVKRKPLRSLSGYPYRPARIVPRPYDITKRWYIVFYAWDVGTDQLVRKRVLHNELMEIPDHDSRLKFASQASEEITYFLKHDWHLLTTPKKNAEVLSFRNYSILDAYDRAVKYKQEREELKPSSITNYKRIKNSIIEFLKHKKLSKEYLLRNADYAFWDLYFEYLKTVRHIGAKTYNYRRGQIHAVMTVLIRMDSKIFNGINPIKEIRTLKTKTLKHAAFTDDQLRTLITAIKKTEPHIALLVQFLFYTLARPEELRHLKVGDIDVTKKRILFQAEFSKTGIENYVGISERLAEIITASGILAYPQHFYVFNNKPYHTPGQKIKHDHRPGLIQAGRGYFYKRIRKYIISTGLVGINSNFTPYAIKHTGAISLFLATKDVSLVQRQCRHENMETTLKYLRDLGLFTNFDQLNGWSGPI